MPSEPYTGPVLTEPPALLWERAYPSLGDHFEPWQALVIANGKVFFSRGPVIHVLDEATGEGQDIETSNVSELAATHDGRTVYAVGLHLTAWDTTTLTQRWRVLLDEPGVSVAVDETGATYVCAPTRASAYEPGGALRWTVAGPCRFAGPGMGDSVVIRDAARTTRVLNRSSGSLRFELQDAGVLGVLPGHLFGSVGEPTSRAAAVWDACGRTRDGVAPINALESTFYGLPGPRFVATSFAEAELASRVRIFDQNGAVVRDGIAPCGSGVITVAGQLICTPYDMKSNWDIVAASLETFETTWRGPLGTRFVSVERPILTREGSIVLHGVDDDDRDFVKVFAPHPSLVPMPGAWGRPFGGGEPERSGWLH